jgi:hypothetical protein
MYIFKASLLSHPPFPLLFFIVFLTLLLSFFLTHSDPEGDEMKGLMFLQAPVELKRSREFRAAGK